MAHVLPADSGEQAYLEFRRLSFLPLIYALPLYAALFFVAFFPPQTLYIALLAGFICFMNYENLLPQRYRLQPVADGVLFQAWSFWKGGPDREMLLAAGNIRHFLLKRSLFGRTHIYARLDISHKPLLAKNVQMTPEILALLEDVAEIRYE